MANTRPHRRDRRVTAPNTRGGIVRDLTVLSFAQWIPVGVCVFRNRLVNTAGPAPGYIQPETVTTFQGVAPWFKVYLGGVEDTGWEITVGNLGDHNLQKAGFSPGDYTLVIEPFVPLFNTRDGIPCAGGVIEWTA